MFAEPLFLRIRQTPFALACVHQGFIRAQQSLSYDLGNSALPAFRTHIPFVKRIAPADNDRQQSAEVTVLHTGHQGFVLPERTRQQHTQPWVLDLRCPFDAVSGDRLMFGSLAKCRVVVRSRRAPNVGNDRSFTLVQVAAAVLLFQRFVERRQGTVAGNKHRILRINHPHHLQGLVRDTLSACRSREDEALEVRVVLLARRTIGKIQIRHARARRRKRRHQDDVLFLRRGSQRNHLLYTLRKLLHVEMFDDAEVFPSLLIQFFNHNVIRFKLFIICLLAE